MKWYSLTIGCTLQLALAGVVFGHGTPIHVEQVEGQLVVSQGIPDDGFAQFMYVEDDDEGLPFEEFSLDPLGAVVLWNIPGLEVFGLDNSASLSIQPILRPARGTNPIERRLVWYWNPQTEEVESSTAPFHLLNSSNDFVTLPAGETTLPPRRCSWRIRLRASKDSTFIRCSTTPSTTTPVLPEARMACSRG